MKLKLNRHHLAIKTPHWEQARMIETGLRSWADQHLPQLLAQRLTQFNQAKGYICINKLDIHLLISLQNGLLPADLDAWVDQIVNGLLHDLAHGLTSNIRRFSDESQFIAAYVIELCHYGRAQDWPFKPWYQQTQSVADNLVAKLAQKVLLLPEVVLWLRQQQQVEQLFTALEPRHCRQLLTAMGCPLKPALYIAKPLDLSGQLETLSLLLAKLRGFEADKILLLLALSLENQSPLPYSTEHWQVLAVQVVLMEWLTTSQGQQLLEPILAGQPVEVDDHQIKVLYQLCCNDAQTRAWLCQLLSQAQRLLTTLPIQPAKADSLGLTTAALDQKLLAKANQNSEIQAQQRVKSSSENQPTDSIEKMVFSHNNQLKKAESEQLNPVGINKHEQTDSGQDPTEVAKSVKPRLADEVAIKGDTELQTGSPGYTPPKPVAPFAPGYRSLSKRSPSPRDRSRQLVENINHGGLALVLAALIRHPMSQLLSPQALWMLCCHGVPKILRPLAYSDLGLRLLCLGDVPWVDVGEICAKVKADPKFIEFSRLQGLDLEQAQAWVLGQMAKYLTGFESSSTQRLFSHFVDHPGKVVVLRAGVYCRINKPPLYIVVALSALFNQQPSLASWPDVPWSIQWQE